MHSSGPLSPRPPHSLAPLPPPVAMVSWFVSGLPRIGGFPVLAIPAVVVFLLAIASLFVHRWYARHLERFRDSPDFAIQQLAQRTKDFGVGFGELVFGRLLGKGSQGEVFEAQWRGLLVAVKKVDTRTVAPEIVDEFVAEADIMRRLRHPCITLFMGLSLETNSLCIVTELVSRGSLFDILQDAELSGVTWKRALQIAVDIASGMTYLHSHNPPILHRDLKSLNILVTSLWRGKVADFGMTRFQQDPNEEKSMTQCLEASTRILLADGTVRAISDPAVKVGTMLAGEQGPVRILSKQQSTSARMLTIRHADGFAYTVTPNHLVTLRWAAGPETIVHTAVDGCRSVEVNWWQFDGKSFEQHRTAQRHFPPAAADDDDLRSQARSEWDASRLTGGDGCRALFVGDLVDVAAETLAMPEVWSLLFPPTAQPLATSRRISMSANELGARSSAPELPRSIPSGVVSSGYAASAAAVCSKARHALPDAAVADNLALSMRSSMDGTPGFTYSAVQTDDEVQLLLVLPSPASLLFDECGRKSTSLLNLERVFNALHVRPGADVHVTATSLQCIAEDPSAFLPSDPVDSLPHIREHQHTMLQHLCASQLVVFGSLNTFYWRSVAAVRGVSDVKHVTRADGLMRTTLTFTPDGAAAPRQVIVLYAADPRMGTFTPEITPVIAAVLGLTCDDAALKLHTGVDLVRIEATNRSSTPIVIMGVDGDNRFALEDGTLTHNCGSPLWMAPEMIKNESYDGKADVYSFSIVLWELYTKRVPYRALNLSPSQLVVKVVRDGLRPDIPKDCPKKLVKLLQACWHRDAAQRPTFAAILKTLEGFLADKAMLRHKPGEKQKSKSAAASAAAALDDDEEQEDGGDEDEAAGGMPTDELQAAFEALVGVAVGDKSGTGASWMVDSKEVEVSNVRLLSEAEQQALGTSETSVVEDGSIQPLLLHTQQHALSSPAVAAAPIVGLSPSVGAIVASSAASSRASSRLGMTLKLRAHRVYRAKFRGRGVIVKKCTLSDSARSGATTAVAAAPSGRMAPASSTVQLSSFGSSASDDVSIPSDLTDIDHRALHTLLSRAASLRHPNIVLFMGAYVEFDHVGIIEEECARGSLSRILSDQSIAIEWDQSLQFLIDAASALNYLALSGVGGGVHPDLRTSRLLVTSNWRVKLSGCAFVNLDRKLGMLAREAGSVAKEKKTPPNGPMHHHSGSLSTLQQQHQDASAASPMHEVDVSFWTAPECVDDDPLRALTSSDPAAGGRTLSASVYSFSLIMWHVVLRSLPYAGKFGAKLRAKIKDGLRLPIPNSLSPKFRALIKSCWASDPAARPSFGAILTALQQIKRDGPPRIVLDQSNSLLYRKAATVFAHASKDELTLLKDWGRNRGQKGDMVIASSSSSAAAAALPSGPALAAFHATFTDLYLCDSRVFGSSYELTGRFEHEYRKVGMVRAKRMDEPFAIRTGGGEGPSTVELAAAAAAAAASSLYPAPSFPTSTASILDSPASLLIVEQGNAGDYIVQNEKGDQWCVEGKVMESSYVVVDEGGREAVMTPAAIAAALSNAAAAKLARPSISSRVPPQASSASAPAPAPALGSVQLVGLGAGQLVPASPSSSLAPPKPARSGHKHHTSSSKKPSKRVADSSAQ